MAHIEHLGGPVLLGCRIRAGRSGFGGVGGAWLGRRPRCAGRGVGRGAARARVGRGDLRALSARGSTPRGGRRRRGLLRARLVLVVALAHGLPRALARGAQRARWRRAEALVVGGAGGRRRARALPPQLAEAARVRKLGPGAHGGALGLAVRPGAGRRPRAAPRRHRRRRAAAATTTTTPAAASGSCYSSTSTATRLAANGRDVETVSARCAKMLCSSREVPFPV